MIDIWVFSQRDGENLTFIVLIQAIVSVYNISYPLAFLLTLVGFITCGKFTYASRPGLPPLSSHTCHATGFQRLAKFCSAPRRVRWTLSLRDLCQRGPRKITHDASFVHPNLIPSDHSDTGLVSDLLKHAMTACDDEGRAKDGLSLVDLAHIHEDRETTLNHPLSPFHKQVVFGECAIAWSVMRAHISRKGAATLHEDSVDVIPTTKLESWFGEEQLPKGWWDKDGTRPSKQVGLLEVKQRARKVKKISEDSRLPVPGSVAFGI